MCFDFVFISSSSIFFFLGFKIDELLFTMQSNPSKAKLKLNQVVKRGGRQNIMCQKTNETFCQIYICDCVIVPLHQCLQSKSSMENLVKIGFVVFCMYVCIKVFFFKKPKMPKRLLFVPMVGSIL